MFGENKAWSLRSIDLESCCGFAPYYLYDRDTHIKNTIPELPVSYKTNTYLTESDTKYVLTFCCIL